MSETKFGGNDQIGNMQTGYELIDKIKPRSQIFSLGKRQKRNYSIKACLLCSSVYIKPCHLSPQQLVKS